MDMAQGQIAQAGFAHLGRRHRAAGGGQAQRVAVEYAHAPFRVPLRPETLQQARAVHAAVARAVYPAVQRGEVDVIRPPGKNMHIFRPAFRQPGGRIRAVIVISGSDAHRHGALLQRPPHGVHPVLGRGGRIKQVPRQQHQVAFFLPAQGRDAAGKRALHLPQPRPRLLGQGAEGGIQVPIRAVKYFQSHWSTLSARRHFPVALSRVNRTPSILVAPSAQR